jgi:hypothetical protein
LKHTLSIKLTDETSSFDPTVLSNRASAIISLQKFDDGLRDAENYISHRPKCCKDYAKKAQAWAEKANCAAALAYYYKRDIFSSFATFKELFHLLSKAG